jgi:hypothetical protein
MRYGFYSKRDTTAELVDSREFRELAEAIKFFAAMKGLTVEQFLEIFTVIPVNSAKNG